MAEIAEGIYSAEGDEARLALLMNDRWEFRLPTASAILSVLYPGRFSVYDIRACETLEKMGLGNHKNIGEEKNASATWLAYQRFLNAVRAVGPASACLRSKDYYLWGHSLFDSISKELNGPAKVPKPGSPKRAK